MEKEKEFKETAGMQFARAVKPAGCIFLLLILVGVLYLCFTTGTDPIPGYEAPQETEYYQSHLEQLQTELLEHVFPELEGVCGSEIVDGHVKIILENDSFAVTRSAILRYFDESLLEFEKKEND